MTLSPRNFTLFFVWTEEGQMAREGNSCIDEDKLFVKCLYLFCWLEVVK